MVETDIYYTAGVVSDSINIPLAVGWFMLERSGTKRKLSSHPLCLQQHGRKRSWRLDVLLYSYGLVNEHRINRTLETLPELSNCGLSRTFKYSESRGFEGSIYWWKKASR